MTNWPPIGIMLLTYDRIDYAKETIKGVMEHASYSGEIVWHIADDGSPDGYREALLEMLPEGTSVTNAEGSGYGGSFNLASQVLHSKAGIILPLEDDWQLLRPFSFDSFVEVLQGENEITCIRMGYIGYTQPLEGTFTYLGDQHYLLLDPKSKEPHVWAGHPRLETVLRQREVGEWPDHVDAGTTEFRVASRSVSRKGVAWPIDTIKPRGDLFAHIGSIQARSDQKEEEAVAQGIS